MLLELLVRQQVLVVPVVREDLYHQVLLEALLVPWDQFDLHFLYLLWILLVQVDLVDLDVLDYQGDPYHQ